MKEFIAKYNLSMFLTALLGVVLGILLIIYPDDSLVFAARFLSAVIFVMGVVLLVPSLASKNFMASVISGVVSIMGVWLFIQPDIVVKIIPIVVGVILVVCGIQDFILAVEGIKKKGSLRVLMVFIAVISMFMGAICIIKAFGIMELTTRIIGILIIINSLSDVFMSLHIGRVRHKFDKENNVVAVQVVDADSIRDVTEDSE